MRKITALVLLVCAAGGFAFAQATGSEKSIEEKYLEQAVVIQVIRELRQGTSLENKEEALDNAEVYIRNWGPEPAVVEQLKEVALEGTKNRVMSEGRVANNYAMLRQRAVRILGAAPTEESRRAVIDVLDAEEEPTVAAEAVLALKEIAKVDSANEAQSVQVATRAFQRFSTRAQPDNWLAFMMLDLYEHYIQTGMAQADATTISTIRAMADSRANYNSWVRERAKRLLKFIVDRPADSR